MDKLTIAGRAFDSRLLVGTGKFTSPQVMAEALAASGAEIVTVALRRFHQLLPSHFQCLLNFRNLFDPLINRLL